MKPNIKYVQFTLVIPVLNEEDIDLTPRIESENLFRAFQVLDAEYCSLSGKIVNKPDYVDNDCILSVDSRGTKIVNIKDHYFNNTEEPDFVSGVMDEIKELD